MKRETPELYDLLVAFVTGLERVRDGVVLVIDEAHDTPVLLVEHLNRLTELTVRGRRCSRWCWPQILSTVRRCQ